MVKINTVVQARDVQRVIDEDPWDVNVYRKGLTPDQAETKITFVGTVKPHGARGVPLTLASSELAGEAPLARYAWVLLVPQGIAKLQGLDEVIAIQRGSLQERHFTIFYCGKYAYKQEAILDERQ